MGGHATGTAAYDAALQRRQALMGASGARALVKNWKVARIAAFACIGGVLYGYNQGLERPFALLSEPARLTVGAQNVFRNLGHAVF